MAQTQEQPGPFQRSTLSAASTEQHHSLSNDYPEKGFYRFHHHHTVSDSTAYCSNDSSPTTTASTVDDSSATEPSPGSSPESPPPSTFAAGMKQPPARKGRNLKNLAVNTSRQTGRAASTTSLPLKPLVVEPLPNILSPGFVKPPSPQKRKQSTLGLTLLTPGSKPAPPEVKLAISATPGFGRPSTLRHFQSSPSLPIIPDFHHNDNTRIPSKQLARLETILSPIAPTPIVQLPADDEQNFDVPLSREEKPEAYPDGPICVYAPYVDLYLEPNAQQCRTYDVILNVASEVRNPLADQQPAEDTPDIRIDGGGGIQYAPRRGPLIAQENTMVEPSPTTPKATPLSSSFPIIANVPQSNGAEKDPEYIHIPWEHNSDIVPDLLRLSKVIDEKVKEHKRVLVHCQCGVSRSASLVVAYGLYKDPTLSVQEAYDAVKVRSRWIGPNMNLIMQLQEFRSSLARGGLLSSNRGMTPITPSSAFSEWRGPFSARPSDASNIAVPMSASVAENPQKFPVQVDVTAITPGPSSAPSNSNWPGTEATPPVPIRRTRAVSAVKRTSAYVDPSGHLIPVVQVMRPASTETLPSAVEMPAAVEQTKEEPEAATPTEALVFPRSAEFAMVSLQPPEEVAAADAFGIMSPTTTEFSSSPFDRSALLASLGMGLMHPETPRRATSLRTAAKPAERAESTGLTPSPRRLRNKISAPSIREQRQLQDLQARIQSNLSLRESDDSTQDVLMSPRAMEFTSNPFALSLAIPEVESEEKEVDRSPEADPRSPAHAGSSPFSRNILDVL
ncbi:tyrosine/serine/threonine protein phosphatase [Recurvomyces mirabilis]|nr:tyrosine/serine/threonine protein phosphatase [Recurvomyces mirabilis]